MRRLVDHLFHRLPAGGDELLCALAIAWSGDERGYSSVSTIATAMRLPDTRALAVVQRLADRGLVERLASDSGRGRAADRYRLIFARLRDLPALDNVISEARR